MSDLATFATEYFVPTVTAEVGVTELRRFAGPYIKASGFGEAGEIAARLSIGPGCCDVSVVGQMCDGEVRPEPARATP